MAVEMAGLAASGDDEARALVATLVLAVGRSGCGRRADGSFDMSKLQSRASKL